MDELLLSKVRLGVVAELLNFDWVAFSELARALDVSNGNLGAHVSKLVDAGYVDEDQLRQSATADAISVDQTRT